MNSFLLVSITIATFNVAEYVGYISVTDNLGVPFFFAAPYHKWERESNENIYCLIRQYIPKKTA
tara:strand:+ start:993 stop:1184 length:192 start_codon:yes stop_codon:yes gene_type:complete